MIGILTIGTELLIGRTLNTNAANLARYLDRHGLAADLQLSCIDDEAALIKALDFLSDCRLLLVTGGLGETHDDISQRVFDQYFEHTTKTIIPNHIGTASGYTYDGAGKHAILFPGPPIENQAMFDAMLPFLDQARPSKQYHVTGYGEYALEQALLPHMPQDQFATYTDQGFTTIRILSQDYDDLMHELFGESLIGVGEETIEQTITALATKHQLRIATVESITSGEVAQRLTHDPGASKFFYGGLVVYQEAAKTDLAAIAPSVLAEHSAVSPVTTRLLAENFLRDHPVDLVLAVTGYADHPDEALHGQSYLCVATKRGVMEQAIKYTWMRSRIRSRVAFAGLDLIRRTILNYFENGL
ncbi:MAG TPA: nicotinamide-nucleotide amidohydrolase family protein [Tissierellia bacterium]|nr:nicotinamide-nucleotide amidohydrolase family protein [Tissierellia bacterium]